ncbi:MAG: 2-hydroxyacid dehydrogenase [Chitinophagaceae bacterium]|nr:2-hydroxyacid dehydrogenase [Oligoflexus sp.]
MKLILFSGHHFERDPFIESNKAYGHDLQFLDVSLNKDTAKLAEGHDCVAAFTTDKLDAECLALLAGYGVKLIALRSAGFNHVDLEAAHRLKLQVVRVPQYSPYSVAEYAVGLMLTLNRKLHKSYNRVKELNFSLEGLVGFDMHGKTVGVIGTGRIGSVLAEILSGFGCKVIAYDPVPSTDLVKRLKVSYVPQAEVFKSSDIISLHVPLSPKTRHLIDEGALLSMKKGVMLINTGRGGLIDAHALIEALKSGHLGSAGLDVYEEEEGVFFEDHSLDLIQDDILARLLTFPNVFLSSHQGFLTKEALHNIAKTTLENASDFEKGRPLQNLVVPLV